MKIHIYKMIFWSSIISIFLNMGWVIWQNAFVVEKMSYVSSPFPVSINDRVYVFDNDKIFIHNKNCGIFQCFDFEGNFVWGIHLQVAKNVDSTAISYNNGKLYFWESITDTVYSYENFQLVDKETNVNIMSDTDFQLSYPMEDNEYIGEFSWNGNVNIVDSNGNVIENIGLDTKIYYYTIISAWIGFFVSVLILLWVKQKIEHMEQ